MLTVKTLREWLDQQEATWTETDDLYLGTFDSQVILVDYYRRKEDGGELQYNGVGPSEIAACYELGILISPSDHNALNKE